MEEQTKTFIDPPTGQQIQHINPMEKNRQTTDKLFLFVFPSVVVVWLASCISGLIAYQRPSSIDDEYAETFREIMDFIDPFALRNSTETSIKTIARLVLSTVVTSFCLFLYEKWTKFFAYFAMGFLIIVFSYNVIIDLYLDYFASSVQVSFVSVFFSPSQLKLFILFELIAMIVCTISFLKVDKNVPCNIIKDFCRTIVRSPLIIIFTGFISILVVLVASFAYHGLRSTFLSDRNVYHRGCNGVVIILGGICVLSFIFNFAIMVISDHTVNYYWKNASFKHTLARVLRNHMGTIIFSSMPFIPFVCTLIQALKHKGSRKYDENIILYLAYLASKLYLTMSMGWYTLTFSSIYGTGFVKSTQKMFDTLLRRCLLYLATIGVSDALIFMTIFFVGKFFEKAGRLSMQFCEYVFGKDKTKIDDLLFNAELYHLLTLAVIMHQSARAHLANKIIILDKEDQYNEGKAEILNRL